MRLLPGLFVSLALGLTAPALADAPDDLPGQVAGVIGSGPSLSLKFRPVAGEPTRVLSLGDVYADGWVLTGLTPSVATLTKAGMSRSVGLNPSGALAAAPSDARPSEVKVIFSAAELAYFDALIAGGHWNGQAEPGRTLDETRRGLLYHNRLAEARARGITDAKEILGPDYADWISLGAAGWVAERQYALDRGDINTVRRFDGLPPVGPDKILVPAGTSPDAAFRAAGLVSQAGYAEQGPEGSLDADGNRTFTRSAVSGPSIAALRALIGP
ncbi:MAG: hypothetical protein JWM33_3682 [Caulobacteraceae bacterium]|nr:hypothetical protein [Caulobacteraceae bacterium]